MNVYNWDDDERSIKSMTCNHLEKEDISLNDMLRQIAHMHHERQWSICYKRTRSTTQLATIPDTAVVEKEPEYDYSDNSGNLDTNIDTHLELEIDHEAVTTEINSHLLEVEKFACT